jgi:hypothetical protein
MLGRPNNRASSPSGLPLVVAVVVFWRSPGHAPNGTLATNNRSWSRRGATTFAEMKNSNKKKSKKDSA